MKTDGKARPPAFTSSKMDQALQQSQNLLELTSSAFK